MPNRLSFCPRCRKFASLPWSARWSLVPIVLVGLALSGLVGTQREAEAEAEAEAAPAPARAALPLSPSAPAQRSIDPPMPGTDDARWHHEPAPTF